MRIATPALDGASARRRIEDLERLASQPSDRELRPCPGCDLRCPCSASAECTCACSSACSHTPRAMSSDPKNHPIEPHIAPLVYALNCMRVCPPCWSCEGHLDAKGNPWRQPAVWFTARSVAYPHVIAQCLREELTAGTLAAPWLVSAVAWGQYADSAFAIQPEPRERGSPDLERLWKDIARLSAALPSRAQTIARSFAEAVRRGAAYQDARHGR